MKAYTSSTHLGGGVRAGRRGGGAGRRGGVKTNKEQEESEKGKYLPDEVSDMTSNSWCHSIFTVADGYESPQLSR